MTDQAQVEIVIIAVGVRMTMFGVRVFARSGHGDEMVRPVVWQGSSYEEAILASERYASATGLPVADLVVR